MDQSNSSSVAAAMMVKACKQSKFSREIISATNAAI